VQLASIVEHCGQHALTIDMAGGYIKEYGHGDPATPLNLGTAEELQAAVENEPDDDKRTVLKQGIRFGRIAQRYREAMQGSDEAALSLLERICLFRLGVDCDTLAAIFTGPAAEKVAGKALANLDLYQLRNKLDWLVKMRIIEATESFESSKIRYTVHPAIKDGFIRGLGGDATLACHEAIRKGLDTVLGAVPGTNPCDGATLDRLEEIVHHTLRAGYVVEAWGMYRRRLGGCHNLIAKLNDFSRAARITSSILHDPVPSCPLTSQDFVVLYSDYGYSNLQLGRSEEARRALSEGLALCESTGDRNRKTLANNLAFALYLMGRLRAARKVLEDLLCHARDAATYVETLSSIAQIDTHLGHAQIQITEADVPVGVRPQSSKRLPITIRSDGLDNRRFIGGYEARVADLRKQYPYGHQALASALLDHARLLLEIGEWQGANTAVSDALKWAIRCDVKPVLCQCYLIRGRIALSTDSRESLTTAELAISQGLKIARDCGYGLYHIDMLLERARFHLLRGDAGAALDDIEVALDTGIPANEETGQVELLAASHEECGYAWAIPSGFQLRAEALLLRAAQTLGNNRVPATPINELAADVAKWIRLAKQLLHEALDRWHELREPEPTEDNNFVDPDTSKKYNYKANGTHQVLVDLEARILTKYRLSPIELQRLEQECEPLMTEKVIPKRFSVALSFPGEHRDYVEEMANALAETLSKDKVFYDRFYEAELSRPNLDTYLQDIYHNDCELVVVALCKEYDQKEWCGLEFRAIRDLIKKRRDDEIMFLRVADGDVKGVFGIDGYVDCKNRSAADIAEIICERLSLVQAASH
jgi:tetratricopeptide (TPR) repeat protein